MMVDNRFFFLKKLLQVGVSTRTEQKINYKTT